MGMFRQISAAENRQEADIRLQKIIEEELSKGTITLSGRRSVWVHLRTIGILASQYVFFYPFNHKNSNRNTIVHVLQMH